MAMGHLEKDLLTSKKNFWIGGINSTLQGNKNSG